MNKIYAEISAGELVDKITILEIKKEKITNKEKLIENKKRELEKKQRFGKEFIEFARNVYKSNDERAKIKLKIKPNYLIIDGNKFKPYKKIKHTCIIQGDNKYLSIAAASIIAKNYRDNFMCNKAKKFEIYSWETNFGYPTKKHKEAIKKFGISNYHRKSFKLS